MNDVIDAAVIGMPKTSCFLRNMNFERVAGRKELRRTEMNVPNVSRID